MSPESIIDIFRQMLLIVIGGVLITVIPGLVIGLVIAILQAATQINEATLSFLPKLIVILGVIAIIFPWLVNMLVNYTHDLIINIPYVVG